jgi:hypothetical protein
MRPMLLCLFAAACGDLGIAPSGAPDAAPAADAGPPVDPLARWSGCMTMERWEAASMGAWASKPSSLGTVCSDCHEGGLAFFYANASSSEMLAYNRYQRFVGGFFTLATDPVTGAVDVAPAWAKLKSKGEGANNHPLYAVGQGETYFQYLEAFAPGTREARDAGECDPPEYPAVPE